MGRNKKSSGFALSQKYGIFFRKQMKKFIVIPFILFLSCSTISIKNTDELDSLVLECDKQLTKVIGKSIPGAVVVFIENGEIYYQKAFGYKDKKSHKEMSAETIFQVASISKTVFALTVIWDISQGRNYHQSNNLYRVVCIL